MYLESIFKVFIKFACFRSNVRKRNQRKWCYQLIWQRQELQVVEHTVSCSCSIRRWLPPPPPPHYATRRTRYHTAWLHCRLPPPRYTTYRRPRCHWPQSRWPRPCITPPTPSTTCRVANGFLLQGQHSAPADRPLWPTVWAICWASKGWISPPCILHHYKHLLNYTILDGYLFSQQR